MNSDTQLPDGWDNERIERVAAQYDHQEEDEAVSEDEAAFADGRVMMEIPADLVPEVRRLIAGKK